MKDPLWRAAWDAVSPLLRDDDIVLAPNGDWPLDPGRLRPYRGAITIADATILFLHKSQLPAIRKTDLTQVMQRWHCVFANNVFVCFTRDKRLRIDYRHLHRRAVRRLSTYIHSASLKRQPGTIFLIHLPKAAGTSVWDALRRRVRSHVYYDSIESFRHNPPAPGEYDLVGGHLPLHFVAPHVQDGDRIACLLRDPTTRFRAAFLHSRRTTEDPMTFTSVMKTMREQPLREALDQPDIVMELQQQLIMLGFAFDSPYAPERDADIMRSALHWIRDDKHIFGTTDHLARFTQAVGAHFGLTDVNIRQLNGSDHEAQMADEAEFEAVRHLVGMGNHVERRLYDVVRQKLEEQP